MRLEKEGQTITAAVLLTLSGGFLDAFTYVAHHHVFANAMTGNIVLLAVSAAAGNWGQAAHHLPPLVAFVAAVFVIHLFDLKPVAARINRPVLFCLLMEIAFLSVAALIHLPDSWLIPGITFTATLQTLSFSRLEGLTYSSVVTTGNLRQAAKRFFEGLLPLRRDQHAYREAFLLGLISLSFCVGAFIGGYSVMRYSDRALLLVVLWLLYVLIRVLRYKPGNTLPSIPAVDDLRGE